MKTYAKLAISAAAVVVVALVGIRLLPVSGGVGGGGPAASPTASPSPTPRATATPSPAAVFPNKGELAVGSRQAMTLAGVPLTLSVPAAGWLSNGTFAIDKGSFPATWEGGFIFWSDATPTGVFTDPCGQTKGPAIGSSAADLAAAVATVPGTDLIGAPSNVTVGGYPAKRVVLHVREDARCPAGSFYLWYAPGPDLERYATELGSTIRVWIVDVNGTLVWIDGETSKDAAAGVAREMQQIIDSIQFAP